MAKAEPTWRIVVIGGKKAKHLGIVTAPEAKAAESKAVEVFGVSGERRNRVVAQPIAKPVRQ
jgi:hypothetical protein